MTERTFLDEIASASPTVSRGFQLSPQHKSLAGPSFLLCVLLSIGALLEVASVGASLGYISFFEQILNGGFTSENEVVEAGTSLDNFSMYLGFTAIGVFALTVVAYCVFVYRAASNIHRSNARGMTTSPGWAVGWSFIPFVNLVKIYEVMRDVWQSSHDPVRGAISPPAILGPWWGCYLVGNILATISGRLQDSILLSDEFNADLMNFTLWLTIISSILSLIAVVLLFLIVRSITRAQANWTARSLGPARDDTLVAAPV